MIQSFKTNVTQVSCDNVCLCFFLEVGKGHRSTFSTCTILGGRAKTWGRWDFWWPFCSFYCFVMPCWRWVYTMNIIYIYTVKYMDVFFTIYTFTHVIDTDVCIYLYLQWLCVYVQSTHISSLFIPDPGCAERHLHRELLWAFDFAEFAVLGWRFGVMSESKEESWGYILPF